ncbi:MAG TPA: ATP-binding protein [Streptosporangiaceae bacterium]|nr:ATP-binding protein [Streptosporangiaceae bacterium]
MQQLKAPIPGSGAGAAAIVGLAASRSSRTRHVRLAAVPSAVPWARRILKHVLEEWELESLGDCALLAVSELVTNAVQRSPGTARFDRETVELTLKATGDGLRIEVWDANPAVPVLKEADLTGDRGRGLVLVDFLSDAWGHRPAGRGKVVWCEMTDCQP